jgi:hypothetical protein
LWAMDLQNTSFFIATGVLLHTGSPVVAFTIENTLSALLR